MCISNHQLIIADLPVIENLSNRQLSGQSGARLGVRRRNGPDYNGVLSCENGFTRFSWLVSTSHDTLETLYVAESGRNEGQLYHCNRQMPWRPEYSDFI